tara:strand:+ start:98 stop:310 length:213 start_codon:yes stop_codon:yes gene_type:complete
MTFQWADVGPLASKPAASMLRVATLAFKRAGYEGPLKHERIFPGDHRHPRNLIPDPGQIVWLFTEADEHG